MNTVFKKRILIPLSVAAVVVAGTVMELKPEFSPAERAVVKSGISFSKIEEEIVDDVLADKVPSFDLTDAETARSAFLSAFNKLSRDAGELSQEEIAYLIGHVGEDNRIEERIKYLARKKLAKHP